MASQFPEDHECYVVFKGRVDKPTIFTSWSQAHPRVIRSKGVDNDFKEKKFKSPTLARIAIESKGFTEWEEALKCKPEDKKISFPRGKFYAVAGCETTGIFTTWKMAQEATTGTSACFRLCESKDEAREFIQEWKDAYADVWRRAIRKGLDNGWKPKDMEFDISSVLIGDDEMTQKLEQLDLKEETRE